MCLASPTYANSGAVGFLLPLMLLLIGPVTLGVQSSLSPQLRFYNHRPRFFRRTGV